ncbi:MAG: hypothetical protein H6732_17180 [Alphaproteobacteria bacterium]|nr:hypothetical protein [Alphaproteobacteria bacterium]
MNRSLLIALVAFGGCAKDLSFLYQAPIDGLEPVLHLGEIPVIPLTTRDDIRANVVYGEIGPTGTPETGGVTFTFRGVDGPLCIWMDPELATWVQAVETSVQQPSAPYTQPDNLYDDGDLELFAGLSVFYTGTPGASMGDFAVRTKDQLGNDLQVQYVECSPLGDSVGIETNNYAGRGAPESCEIGSSLGGSSYTAVLDAWSLPIDDGRLGFGVVVVASTCEDLVGSLTPAQQECLILGEAVFPGEPGRRGAEAKRRGLPLNTWVGVDEVPSWPGSIDLEAAFCTPQEGFVGQDDVTYPLADLCRAERRANRDAGTECSWQLNAAVEGNGERCYCGNIDDTPRAGSF